MLPFDGGAIPISRGLGFSWVSNDRSWQAIRVAGPCVSVSPSVPCCSRAARASQHRFAQRRAKSRSFQPTSSAVPSCWTRCESRARCRSTRYQAKLAQFLRNYCHRDEASGWTRDKHVRDTGPFVGTLKDGKWTGTYFGTHAPVVTWYSPDMVEWLKANRARRPAPLRPRRRRPFPTARSWSRRCSRRRRPPAPASIRCTWRRPRAPPIMVRDAGGSHDGWFWGWFGWGEKRLAAGLAGAGGQRLSLHGLRPLLHQLPRFGARQLHLCVAAQHQGRAAAIRWCSSARPSSPTPLFESFHEAVAQAKPDDGAAAGPTLPGAVHAHLPALSKARPTSTTVAKTAVGNL